MPSAIEDAKGPVGVTRAGGEREVDGYVVVISGVHDQHRGRDVIQCAVQALGKDGKAHERREWSQRPRSGRLRSLDA